MTLLRMDLLLIGNKNFVKKVATYSTFSSVFLVFMILIIVPQGSHCIKLNKDGGYSLTVALDQFDVNDGTYLEKILFSIKEEFSQLSKWIYSTTNKFHIKHIDILLPSNNHLVKAKIAKIETYKNADIQVSQKTTEIQVKNPNGCGIPGNSLRLPLQLFINDDASSTSFRQNNFVNGKTLLPYFARYRWGVFEEYGVDSDPERYPKFYEGYGLKENGEIDRIPSWLHCGCTNHNSSVMSYPVVESMKVFCDKETHNKFAPTPQNILCKYKSVMEVIRSTDDWKFATDKRNNMSEEFPSLPTFAYLQSSDKPYLYLLLDKDLRFAEKTLLNQIGEEIGKTVNDLDSSPFALITQIGTFPSSSGSGRDFDVDVLFPWDNLSPKMRKKCQNIIEKHFSSHPSPEIASTKKGNFASALFQVSKTIQALGHPKGAVVVILKVGSGISLSGKSILPQHNFEHEIIASLKTANVSLHALEINLLNSSSGINLENVVKQVGGTHVILENDRNTRQQNYKKLENFGKKIQQKFRKPVEDQDQFESFAQTSQHDATVVVYKGYTNGSREWSTYHPGESVNSLQIYLSSQIPLLSPIITLNNMEFSFENDIEWNNLNHINEDNNDNGFRYVHHSELASLLNQEEYINGPISVTFECASYQSCDAYLVILGEVANTAVDHHQNHPYLHPLPITDIFIQISTSSLTNTVNWNDPQVSSWKPFHIYGELVSFNNQFYHLAPSHRLVLTGIVCWMGNTVENTCHNYLMMDDGHGEPDTLKNDGVYSFTFIPTNDGKYFVKIVANVYDSDNSLLLTRTFEYDSILTFEGIDKFQPSIRRINDLRVIDKQGDTVQLEWTAPLTYSADGEELSAESYELRYAEKYNDLLEDFDQCDKPNIKSDKGIPKPLKPGTRQSVNVDVDEEENKNVYFAIRSSFNGMQSEASNFVSSGVLSPPQLGNTEAPKFERRVDGLETIAPSSLLLYKNDDSDDDKDEGVKHSAESILFSDESQEIIEEEANGVNFTDSSHHNRARFSKEEESLNFQVPISLPLTTPQPISWIPPIFVDEDDSLTSTTEILFPITAKTYDDSTYSTTTEDEEEPTEPSTQTPEGTTTASLTTPTTPLSIIPDDEYFFKKPVGYITAGVVGGLILIGLGGTVGYLYWKRHRLIDRSRRNLINHAV